MHKRASVLIVVVSGVVLGAGLAAKVPTRIDTAHAPEPRVSAEHYPELLPPEIDSYPVAISPIMRRSPMPFAAWEQTIGEPAVAFDRGPYDPAVSDYTDDRSPNGMATTNSELVPEDETFSEAEPAYR